MKKLEEIEGIGNKYADKLKAIGIKSINTLLKAGATDEGRKQIQKDSKISSKLILEWVNHIDLSRIKGIGSEYSDLLEEAGVDSCLELSKRVPENLFEALEKVNKKKKLVRNLPTLQKVTNWIETAKIKEKIIFH